MNELVINTHNFESAKNRLKEFSKIQSAKLALSTIKRTDDTTIFGKVIFSKEHKVTGSEFNSRLNDIQNHFIELNENTNKTINEFGQIYSALEALDKDYIKAILTSIKATEKTSESIQVAQERIIRIADDQKKTLEVLLKFKQKLDSYAHLDNIDKIWNEFLKFENINTTLQTNEKKINDLSKNIEQQFKETSSILDFISKLKKNVRLFDIDKMWNEFLKFESLKIALQTNEKKIIDLSKNIEEQLEEMLSILDFIEKLEKNVHLFDIDKMWDSLINVTKNLTNISDNLNSFKDTISKQSSDIKILLSFKENILSYKHLKDIDEIWNKNEKHEESILKMDETIEKQKNDLLSNTKDISELNNYRAYLEKIEHLNDVDIIWEKIQDHIRIVEELKQQDIAIQKLVEVNKINIYNLNEYREKLEDIKHLKDIDNIWNKSEEYQVNFHELDNIIEKQKNEILLNTKNINELSNYRAYLEKIEHLNDVDIIWEKIQDHIRIVEELKQQDIAIQKLVEANKIGISDLKEYREKLEEIEHLKDVDNLWNLGELHSKQLSDIEKESIEAKKIMQTNKEDTDANIKILAKKIKTVSWIAASAFSCAFIELIFILLKVK